MVDAYSDTSAFVSNGSGWVITPRYMSRTSRGQPETTQRDLSAIEAVLGSHERSGQQFNAWDAAWGPVGSDGYPRPLWNKYTGTIDRTVANYGRPMKGHGWQPMSNAELVRMMSERITQSAPTGADVTSWKY